MLEVSRSRFVSFKPKEHFFLSFEDTLVIPIFLCSCYTFFCNRENEHLKKVHPCQKEDNVDLPKNNESNFDDEGKILPAGEGTFFQSLYLGRTYF